MAVGSTALARAREEITSKSRQLSQLRGSSHVAAAGTGAIIVASGAAAGVLDAKVPEIAGVKPSIAGGLVIATAGFFMKSPKALNVATGMLTPHAYQAAFDAAVSR